MSSKQKNNTKPCALRIHWILWKWINILCENIRKISWQIIYWKRQTGRMLVSFCIIRIGFRLKNEMKTKFMPLFPKNCKISSWKSLKKHERKKKKEKERKGKKKKCKLAVPILCNHFSKEMKIIVVKNTEMRGLFWFGSLK